MPEVLNNQIVLVTGGSRGIGRAVALRLARDKPEHIIITYCSDYAAARQTVADIGALGVSASLLRTEVGRQELLRETFDEIKACFGRLDVFVSNAARTAFRSAMELDARSWQRVMDINAKAFLLGSQMAAEIMPDHAGARIIGISSLGSRYFIPQYAALGTAKAAIEALARYLAVELAPRGINVNVVCGGFVDSPSTRLLPDYPAVSEHVASRTPAGKVAQPEDLAGVVALLCSPDADWIRGQTIIADGGYSLVS
ncbi:MAG: SDR family oxidoreductase [Gammaproteobacteria bacterium]